MVEDSAVTVTFSSSFSEPCSTFSRMTSRSMSLMQLAG